MSQNFAICNFYQLSFIIYSFGWKHLHLNNEFFFLMNLSKLIFPTGDC